MGDFDPGGFFRGDIVLESSGTALLRLSDSLVVAAVAEKLGLCPRDSEVLFPEGSCR